MKKLLETECKVAFHKASQRLWVRIAKYVLLLLFVFFFWASPFFWWAVAGLALGGILLHSFYRVKTRAWTRSYGQGLFRWDHDKVMTNQQKRLSHQDRI